MRSAKKTLWAFFFIMPLLILSTGNIFANISENDVDDEIPEITAKVVRISFLQGEAQIRRAGSDDWEKAIQNLPIVEGDEIVTSENTRLEIQIDLYKYLRLDENAVLKFNSLRDEGVALSLPQGSMTVRLLEFDKENSFFEIDAPMTTLAVQKTGTYRIDAGNQDSSEVRFSVTNDGQARIYSENSGFTLRDGRSASVSISGDFPGEWDLDEASAFKDEFDDWALDRDSMIAKRLRDANYDKYYDRDFYGAEELNENGEWIFTRDYGYVWRPYQSAIDIYADWSPYRYGHWRWIPPYGWTWVNDEPWGWATYHHGRWVYADGYWVWSPYGNKRPRRSWWRPALVVLVTVRNNVCWYPLPYGYGYYDYNRHHRRKRNNNYNNNPTPTPTPNPSPTPTGTPGQIEFQMKDRRNQVPRTGIVAVDASEFGRNRKDYRIPTQMMSKEILSKVPDVQSPPILPTFKELNGKVSPDILIQNPKVPKTEIQAKTGVIERKSGVSLDRTLREEKVYENRSPVLRTNNQGTRNNSETRDTGAVTRPQNPITKQDEGNNETPRTQIERTRRDDSSKSDDSKSERRNNDRDTNQTPPIYSPPIQKQERREERKVEQPREERKVEQPREQPRIETQQPRPEPREQPREQPKEQPRQESRKEEPQNDSPQSERKGKP